MQQQRVLAKNTKHALKVGILYFLFRVLLDFIYIHWVSPIFGYSGLLLEPNNVKILNSYLLLFILIAVIPMTEQRVSYIILQLHFIVMVIPLTTLYAVGNLSTNFMLMVFVCFLFQIILIRILPTIKIKKIKNAKAILISLMALVTIMTYFYLLRTQGINWSAFNLGKIYDLRSDQEISDGSISYLITWQYRVINPALLVISYLKKNYKLMILAIGLQILLYLMFPHKEVFLAIGLILIVLYISRFSYKFASFFIYFLSIGSLMFVSIFEISKNVLPFSVLPVRLLYIPASIKFQHYEFFYSHKKLFFSEGTLGKVLGLDYPYSVPSGFLIGGGLNNANTGYLAYAFDNAGFLGMILISVLFVFLLILIDSLVNKENKYAIFALLVYPMIILNDGDLLTLLLTGGLFLLIIILLVFSDIGNGNRMKGSINEK